MRFSKQVPSNFSKANKYRGTNSKLQVGKGGGSQGEKPSCTKCDKKHVGKCLVGTVNCFSCEKSGTW